MGLFRPYNRDSNKANDSTESVDSSKSTKPNDATAGKGAPTPTRKEAEAARMARLNPTPSKKEARRRRREHQSAEQAKYIANQERQPERVLARNFVDSRWTVSEFIWPVLIVLLAASMIGVRVPWLPMYVSYAMWVLVTLLVVEWIYLWRKFKKELYARYPKAKKRGLFMYMSARAMNPRRWRNPAPTINRGDPY